jgi:hypothetical protein
MTTAKIYKTLLEPNILDILYNPTESKSEMLTMEKVVNWRTCLVR